MPTDRQANICYIFQTPKNRCQIHEQQLGPDHPDTATSLNNLAGLYSKQGKYEQAEPLYQRALQICEQQLGQEHPNTRTTRASYTFLLQTMGRENEAGEQGTS